MPDPESNLGMKWRSIPATARAGMICRVSTMIAKPHRQRHIFLHRVGWRMKRLEHDISRRAS